MGARLGLGALLVSAAACAGPNGRAPIAPEVVALGPDEAPPNGRITVRPGDAFAAGELEVRVAAPTGVMPPPVLGRSTRVDGALVFEPRFPLDTGLTYVVTLGGSDGSDGSEGRAFVREVRLPDPQLERTTSVERVLPSADVLPANLLKFYLHFSAPMRRGEAYRHVRLLDAHGEPLDDVLLAIEPELWDPDSRRLTLLFDPGRIKRGLRLRAELGPTLQQGASYTLEVDPGWRDARGAPMLAGFVKSFRTAAPDETSPDPTQWGFLGAPTAGTSAPLVIDLREPLDHALLQNALAVRDPRGAVLTGELTVHPGESGWSWTPARPWVAGRHELVVDPVLEDLAGNSVGRPFEVDLSNPVTDDAARTPVVVVFEVLAGAQ